MSPIETLRSGVVWLNTVLQGFLGVGAFLLQPGAVFLGIESDPLALLALRLVAYGNLSAVLVAGWLLLQIRSASVRQQRQTVRVLAGAGAVYHALAGAENVQILAGRMPVVLAEPVAGPTVFHALFLILLVTAALWPTARGSGA